MPSAARVLEFTDPGCPWAWSAEPQRRRIAWLYGDALAWEPRMVGLAANPRVYDAKGFTVDKQAAAFAVMRERYGMPMDARTRPRMAATLPACRAVVAARLRAPGRERALLRALRVRHFGGELLDQPRTLTAACHDARVDPALLGPSAPVDRALAEDMAAARRPAPAALVLEHKLAPAEVSGLRYTCPSWVIEAGGAVHVLPGFQPLESYEVALANLLPDVRRRADPEDVEEVLAWAGEPLATREVAVVCGISDDEARRRLCVVADPVRLGQAEIWSSAAGISLAA